jgi:hypothetical protein
MIEHGRRIILKKAFEVHVADIADNKTVIAMLGTEGAKAYQQLMQKLEMEMTSMHFIERCPEIGVRIHLLGVGYGVSGLRASILLNTGGRAVGVRRK